MNMTAEEKKAAWEAREKKLMDEMYDPEEELFHEIKREQYLEREYGIVQL